MQTKNALLINLMDSESVHHQEFDIDRIRVKFHYNYLNRRYFLTVYHDDAFLVSNLLVTPNKDLFKGLSDAEYYPIGELWFNTEKEFIDSETIGSVELIYMEAENVS